MKKYFQKLYNETGKKPFTFLNFFLMVGVPIIGIILFSIDSDFIPIAIAISVIAWVVNLVLSIKNFGGKGVGIFFLTLLASIAFFCSFILWPFLKFSFRASGAVLQSNLGNTTASVNASRRAAATKGNISALNWFSYDGRVYQNEQEIMPDDIQGYSLDEGSYTDVQNQAARDRGYANGKDAEMHGARWNSQNNGWM